MLFSDEIVKMLTEGHSFIISPVLMKSEVETKLIEVSLHLKEVELEEVQLSELGYKKLGE